MKQIVTIGLLLVLIGCAPVTQVQERLFRGIYTYGDKVDVVKLCGSDEVYWVWSQPEVQQALNINHTGLTSQAFYIEFAGELLNAPRDNLATDNDGLVRVGRVVTLSDSLPENCQ